MRSAVLLILSVTSHTTRLQVLAFSLPLMLTLLVLSNKTKKGTNVQELSGHVLDVQSCPHNGETLLLFNDMILSSQTSRTPECKRHLETKLDKDDTPESIALELSRFAFISLDDVEVMKRVIQVDTLTPIHKINSSPPISGSVQISGSVW